MPTTYKLLKALDPKPGRYARENPDLVVGDHVKLGFRTDPRHRGSPHGEWMWLQVTAVTGTWPDVVYRGELCNTPCFISPAVLHPGQPVEFRGEHIHSVVRDAPTRPENERETPP
jgi:hypothetical protein